MRDNRPRAPLCHCEERSDEAISRVMSKSGSSGRELLPRVKPGDRFASRNDSLGVTVTAVAG
jgi:hypothetical protein